MGDIHARLRVYLQNRPGIEPYVQLDSVQPCRAGEINDIGQRCGNGWRKVFNVYAKLVFAMRSDPFPHALSCDSWQQYRDTALLQCDSDTALLFTPPQWQDAADEDEGIRIVMGRNYAKGMLKGWPLEWQNAEFAICPQQRLIVCPYFDYRQLSNIKIIQLVDYLHSLVADDRC